MTDGSESPYYSVPEAAEALHVSRATIWRWIDAGRLPAYRVGPRRIRIKVEDLRRAVQPVRVRANEADSLLAELVPRPSPEELARRQAIAAQILAERDERVIGPLTSADLIHQAREAEWRSYGKPRRQRRGDRRLGRSEVASPG